MHAVLRVGGVGSLDDYVDADDVVDCPKEKLLLFNDVVKTCFDSKFERVEFSLLAGEVERTLKDHIVVDVAVDTLKGSLVSPKAVEKKCFTVKNAKRKLSFLDEDVGLPVLKKNKLFHFIFYIKLTMLYVRPYILCNISWVNCLLLLVVGLSRTCLLK